MNSLILTTMTRLLVPLILALAIFILLRGHNAPGGGFIGGLLGAIAFALIEKAQGLAAARKALRFEPMTVAGLGLGAALLAGLWGGLAEGDFLRGMWPFYAPVPEGGMTGWPIGSVLLFDIGVCLVVLGSVTGILFALEETVSEAKETGKDASWK
ncbi:MnhB domain-containing protein [Aureimonas populi]|uniref:MnhB domain-containing protein n=1 Tax=Aureimonas populi TaxID=1701758 RepID=A0ABW5CQG6_9HYPH|nr:MnhB domain-containing protein [Aureimonas populi]